METKIAITEWEDNKWEYALPKDCEKVLRVWVGGKKVKRWRIKYVGEDFLLTPLLLDADYSDKELIGAELKIKYKIDENNEVK